MRKNEGLKRMKMNERERKEKKRRGDNKEDEKGKKHDRLNIIFSYFM